MAKSGVAFSPKEFSVWVRGETAAGTSAIGTSMYQLDVDSVGFPTLNATQVLDVRSGGRFLKDEDFFQDNVMRVTEFSISGTMHLDTGHQLLMQNICNDYSGDTTTVAATYAPPKIQYENGDGSAVTNPTAGDTITVVIAGPDEVTGTANIQVTNSTTIELAGCVVTNFALSADMGTEGGRYKFSATLQTGIKPDLDETTVVGGTPYANSTDKLFSSSSEHLVKGIEVVMHNFTATLDNPAIFYGVSGNGYEGVTRGSEFGVTFDTQIKYDALTKGLVNSFDTQGITTADLFQFTNDAAFGVDIDNGVLTNVAYSEGDIMMLEVSGKATSDGSVALISIDVA